MAIFKIKPEERLSVRKNKRIVLLRPKEKFDSFNADILGLGKIESKSSTTNALSVMFDLAGFTNFCKQIDPQLAVPEFLSEFLEWLFKHVRKTLIHRSFKEGYKTFADLPFLAKYLGDGILFLWDTEDMSEIAIRNVVGAMFKICRAYVKDFYPGIAKKLTDAPPILRCGIARGTIYSVGNGSDFVGPCINMSARLQKLYSLTFCFSRRGLDPTKMNFDFITKKIEIRGIGEELVCMSEKGFNDLDPLDKKKFKAVA